MQTQTDNAVCFSTRRRRIFGGWATSLQSLSGREKPEASWVLSLLFLSLSPCDTNCSDKGAEITFSKQCIPKSKCFQIQNINFVLKYVNIQSNVKTSGVKITSKSLSEICNPCFYVVRAFNFVPKLYWICPLICLRIILKIQKLKLGFLICIPVTKIFDTLRMHVCKIHQRPLN